MIKIKPDPPIPAVTENPRTANIRNAVTKKRGRPKKTGALSNADRQRAYRQRKTVPPIRTQPKGDFL